MWRILNGEDRNKGIKNCMCSSFAMKVTLKEYSWHYGPYALFWGIARQNKVTIEGTIQGKEVIILLPP